MTASTSSSDTALRVADRLARVPGPWDVYAVRTRRYEVHLVRGRVELVRGPIALEGYGIRLLRPRAETLGTGFQSSTDLSEEGIARVVADAETVARHSEFPAPKAELPSSGPAGPSLDIRDLALWDRPRETLDRYVDALVAAFEGEKEVTASFGSIKVSLMETSIANSSGLHAAYSHTGVETEVAVQSFGGPEGAPPGEYWVTAAERRLEPEKLGSKVREWARIARDVRHAEPPPNGEMPVAFPPEVLSEILPAALSFKLSGQARLQDLAPALGTNVGPPDLEIADDGLVPWATGSSPIDDEGVPQRRRQLIGRGEVTELVYDVLHGNALGARSSGSGFRTGRVASAWLSFTHRPNPSTTTLTLPGGGGGRDEEVVEAAGDGVWIQQIGWASPDPVSTAFGGEIRIGYRIRGGKIAEPIRGGTVGGYAMAPAGQPSLLRDISVVGSEPRLCGSLAMPTLLVSGVSVGGEGRPRPTASP